MKPFEDVQNTSHDDRYYPHRSLGEGVYLIFVGFHPIRLKDRRVSFSRNVLIK